VFWREEWLFQGFTCKSYARFKFLALWLWTKQSKKVWAGSRLKEIWKEEFAQELEKTRSSSSQFDKQQSFPLENLARTSKRFLKELVFILIHISNSFPNHVFLNTCCMLSANKICVYLSIAWFKFKFFNSIPWILTSLHNLCFKTTPWL
jgi:hypothetical protein